jgi:hypothetical protein
MIQDGLGKKHEPFSKMNREKSAGGVTHVIQCLPIMHKTQRSNASSIK